MSDALRDAPRGKRGGKGGGSGGSGGRRTPPRRAGILHLALVVVTLLSVWSSGRLRLSNDLTDLFPTGGEAAMLTRFLRAFGGGDLAVFLVEGSPESAETAARALASELGHKASIARVLDETPTMRAPDPTLAWAFADKDARERLAKAVTQDGMRERLRGTRELLLAPGATDDGALALDPLRLAAIPFEARMELAAGVKGFAGGAFVNEAGTARLVIAEPKGSAFEGDNAERFLRDADQAMAKAATPATRLRVTGGHAIAAATANMLRRDMILSSVLSSVLAAAFFLLTFGRLRALVAVLPPLFLGTVWTMGLAAFFPGGISAIATAFAAVVVGVGVDTGVHLYAALLDARREGLHGADAKAHARAATMRPTLLAATAAAFAFASLALSDLSAVRQLGLMCAAGELLTAVAILALLPEIGVLLERGAPPSPRRHRVLEGIAWLTGSRRRAALSLLLTLSPLPLLAMFGLPSANDVLVAIRPAALEPLVTQRDIYRHFGSREGQWLVVSTGKDVGEAAARSDLVTERLEELVKAGTLDGFDALGTMLPAEATQRRRLDVRDKLDLPSRRGALEAALRETGFDAEAFAPALRAWESPSRAVVAPDAHGPFAWLVTRHLATDGGGALAVSYVRPLGERAADEQALRAIQSVGPHTVVTGYHHLEKALKDTLVRDLPRVALVALVLVIVALRALLRRSVDVGIALLAITLELAWVALAMRFLHVRWHVYDALVLPVLVGITMDESMFLLFAARRAGARLEDAILEQGPLVASTALTTAAGFGALLVCRFEGLRDLGTVGALGSALGLVVALIVVPAALRLLAKEEASS